jgi:hypothetical protein
MTRPARWEDAWRAFRKRGFRARVAIRHWSDERIDDSIVAAYIRAEKVPMASDYPYVFDPRVFRAAAIFRQDADFFPRKSLANVPAGQSPISGILYVVYVVERTERQPALAHDWAVWEELEEGHARAAARAWVGPNGIDVPFVALGEEVRACLYTRIRMGPGYEWGLQVEDTTWADRP